MLAADGDSPENTQAQGKSYQNAQVTCSSTIQTRYSILMEEWSLVFLFLLRNVLNISNIAAIFMFFVLCRKFLSGG
jgi:hypothetical protein